MSFWGGIGGGDSLGAVIIGCVVCGFQNGLGVRGLWVSMFDVFWVLFGFSVGVFGLRFPLCVCVWLGAFLYFVLICIITSRSETVDKGLMPTSTQACVRRCQGV